METKTFVKSKTLWGAILAAAPIVWQALGLDLGVLDPIVQGVGLLVVAYGRLTAGTRLAVK